MLSVVGVGEKLAASLLAEMPPPEVLRRGAEMVAYAGLNPSHHRSGTSIDRPTRISKVGNATLRSSLYMPALSAMRYNPAIALVARLKQAGRLKPKQVVVAAMRELLVICFGVLKSGKPFDPAIAMPA
jgi:transposase